MACLHSPNTDQILDDNFPLKRRQLSLGHIGRRPSYTKNEKLSSGTIALAPLRSSTGNLPSPGAQEGNQHPDRTQLRLILPTVIVAAPSPPDFSNR